MKFNFYFINAFAIHSFRAKSTSVEKDSAALGGRKRSRFGEQMPQHAIPPPQVATGDAAALAAAPGAAAAGAGFTAPPPGGMTMTKEMYMQVRM